MTTHFDGKAIIINYNHIRVSIATKKAYNYGTFKLAYAAHYFIDDKYNYTLYSNTVSELVNSVLDAMPSKKVNKGSRSNTPIHVYPDLGFYPIKV